MQMRNQTNTDVQNPQQDDEPTFRVSGETFSVNSPFFLAFTTTGFLHEFLQSPEIYCGLILASVTDWVGKETFS